MLLCGGRTVMSCFLTWGCPPNPSCIDRKAQPCWPEAAGVRAHGSGSAAGVGMACASKGHRGVRVPNLCELCPDPWLSGTRAEGGEEVTLAMGTEFCALGQVRPRTCPVRAAEGGSSSGLRRQRKSAGWPKDVKGVISEARDLRVGEPPNPSPQIQ